MSTKFSAPDPDRIIDRRLRFSLVTTDIVWADGGSIYSGASRLAVSGIKEKNRVKS